jgi:hypothetical protein
VEAVGQEVNVFAEADGGEGNHSQGGPLMILHPFITHSIK